jgi:fluoride exporter
MLNLLLVAAGGALGSAARYLLGTQTLRAFGPGWPYGTFAANLIGGFLMGVLVSVLAHRGGADQERLRLLLGVGVLGGFTTFSAYSLEMSRMLETGAYAQAAAYGSASVFLAVAALFGGMILTRWVLA